MATIKDVAKKCHVSVSTVSRALNDYADINEETKELILKVAKELDYVPNKNARKLVKKINDHFAVITRNLEDENAFHILRGLYDFSDTIEYEVSLHTLGTSIKQRKSYYEYCKENNIAGVLLYGIHTNDPYIEELIEKNFPTVIVDCDVKGENITNITIDNYKAAYEAVSYLIKTGCKNIITIQGGECSYVTIERVNGYKDALNDNGLKIINNIYYGDFNESTGIELLEKAMKENENIDGIFCGSDNIAMGVYKVLKNKGKRIPEDVSVIGFGDINICTNLTPTLSSVKQSMYDFGYVGGKILYGNKTKEKTMKLEYSLKIRESIKNI